jgi:hypothetical protein
MRGAARPKHVREKADPPYPLDDSSFASSRYHYKSVQYTVGANGSLAGSSFEDIGNAGNRAQVLASPSSARFAPSVIADTIDNLHTSRTSIPSIEFDQQASRTDRLWELHPVYTVLERPLASLPQGKRGKYLDMSEEQVEEKPKPIAERCERCGRRVKQCEATALSVSFASLA